MVCKNFLKNLWNCSCYKIINRFKIFIIQNTQEFVLKIYRTKIQFSIKDIFNKYGQIRKCFLLISSHFLKKSSMKNFIVFVQWDLQKLDYFP